MQWEWNHSFLNISYCFESTARITAVVVKRAQGRKMVCCSICLPSPGIHSSEVWLCLISIPVFRLLSLLLANMLSVKWCNEDDYASSPSLCQPLLVTSVPAAFHEAVLPSHNSWQSSEMTDIHTLPAYGLSIPAATAFLWELQPLFPTVLLVVLLPPLQPLASESGWGLQWATSHW